MGLRSNYSNLKSYSIDRFYEKYTFSRERLTRLRGELSEIRSNIKLLYSILEKIYLLIIFFISILILYKLFQSLWQLPLYYIIKCFLLLLIFMYRLLTYSSLNPILLIAFAICGSLFILSLVHLFEWLDCWRQQSSGYIEKLYLFIVYTLLYFYIFAFLFDLDIVNPGDIFPW